MLMQTNSYIVPKERRDEHTRLVQRFRQTLMRLGCDHFETYEQVGVRWSDEQGNGRFVQIMRFRDRKHQQAVEAAERSDPTAQALIREFCELVNLPYQQQQGLFAVGFYKSILQPVVRTKPAAGPGQGDGGGDPPTGGEIEVASANNAQATLPRRVGFFPPPPSVPATSPAGSPPVGSSAGSSSGPNAGSGAAPQGQSLAEPNALDGGQSRAGTGAGPAGGSTDASSQIGPIDVAEQIDPLADGPTALTWLGEEAQGNGQGGEELTQELERNSGNGVAVPHAEGTRPGHWVVSGEREVPIEPADDALIGDEEKPAKAARRRKSR